MESLTEIYIEYGITETRKFILKQESMTYRNKEKLLNKEIRKYYESVITLIAALTFSSNRLHLLHLINGVLEQRFPTHRSRFLSGISIR